MMAVGAVVLDAEQGVLIITDAVGDTIRVHLCDVDRVMEDMDAARRMLHGPVRDVRPPLAGRDRTSIS